MPDVNPVPGVHDVVQQICFEVTFRLTLWCCAHGAVCRSKVVIKKAVNNVYAAVIDDKLVVKLGRGTGRPPGKV